MAAPSATISRTISAFGTSADISMKRCVSCSSNPIRFYRMQSIASQPPDIIFKHKCFGHNGNITNNKRYYFHQPPQSVSLNMASEKSAIFQNFEVLEACRRISTLHEGGHSSRDLQHLLYVLVKELLCDNRLNDAIQLIDVLTQEQGTSRLANLKELLLSTYTKVFKTFLQVAGEGAGVRSFVEFLDVVDTGVSNYEFFQILRVASQLGDTELAAVCYKRLKNSTKFVPSSGIAYGLLLQAHLNAAAMGEKCSSNKSDLSTNLKDMIHFLSLCDGDVEQSSNDKFMTDFGNNAHINPSGSVSANFKNVNDESPNDNLLVRLGNSFQHNDKSSSCYDSDKLENTTSFQQLSMRDNFQLESDEDLRKRSGFLVNFSQEQVHKYIHGVDSQGGVRKENNNSSTQVNGVSNGMNFKGTPSPGEVSDGRMLCPSCGKSFKGQKGLKMHWSRSKICKVI